MAQVDQGGVNVVHAIWHKMAEITTMVIQGEDEEKAIQKVENTGCVARPKSLSGGKEQGQLTGKATRCRAKPTNYERRTARNSSARSTPKARRGSRDSNRAHVW